MGDLFISISLAIKFTKNVHANITLNTYFVSIFNQHTIVKLDAMLSMS